LIGPPAHFSPYYEQLTAQGAVFSGERPNWFSHVGEEHRHMREAVVVFDQSSQERHEIYGLQANLWTRDVNRAHKLSRRLKAGTVVVNNVWGSDITTPFGSHK
jgi:glycine cleavage system aminomethyltransferase T